MSISVINYYKLDLLRFRAGIPRSKTPQLLNFWKDFYEKYFNFDAKDWQNVPKLDFGIILVKIWLKFC